MTQAVASESAESAVLTTGGQFVSFELGSDVFAFPMSAVKEIVRLPRTFPVPHAPHGLIGLFNLRGVVVPALDLRRLLGMSAVDSTEASRIVIVDCGQRVGLLVDRVSRVMSVEADRIEPASALAGTVAIDCLSGVIKDASRLIQLIDSDRVLQRTTLGRTSRAPTAEGGPAAVVASASAERDDTTQFVSFDVGMEEYALEIAEVEEIVRVPASVSAIPGAEPHILGLMDLRGRLLPLLHLERAMGGAGGPATDQGRVVVVRLGRGDSSARVGLVVDRVREVLRVPASLRDPVPSLLAGDSGTPGFIDSVCRLNEGRRIVCVLRTDLLVHAPGLDRALQAGAEGEPEMAIDGIAHREDAQAETQLVVFLLDGQEYGVAIESVQEIIRVPETMNRIPRTPDWVEGVVNLRNAVLAVLDMRARLGLERAERGERQRILVFSIDGVRTGFVVDAVSEVLRLPLARIEPAPGWSADQESGVDRVANLSAEGRMILLLRLEAILDRDEREALRRLG